MILVITPENTVYVCAVTSFTATHAHAQDAYQLYRDSIYGGTRLVNARTLEPRTNDN